MSSLGSTSTPDPDLFDVQRIEVLQGPQGTLCGASSMGGLIKYVTNPPNLTKFEGKVEAGYEGVPGGGTGNSVRALANVPLLSDVLAVRADVFRIAYPGYIDNVFRNEVDVNAALSVGGRVLIIPGTSLMLSTNGESNTATLFDRNSGSVKARIPTGKGPDGALYDTASKLAFVMNGDGHSATSIDPARGSTAGTVALDGAPEAGVSDGRGHIW